MRGRPIPLGLRLAFLHWDQRKQAEALGALSRVSAVGLRFWAVRQLNACGSLDEERVNIDRLDECVRGLPTDLARNASNQGNASCVLKICVFRPLVIVAKLVAAVVGGRGSARVRDCERQRACSAVQNERKVRKKCKKWQRTGLPTSQRPCRPQHCCL